MDDVIKGLTVLLTGGSATARHDLLKSLERWLVIEVRTSRRPWPYGFETRVKGQAFVFTPYRKPFREALRTLYFP